MKKALLLVCFAFLLTGCGLQVIEDADLSKYTMASEPNVAVMGSAFEKTETEETDQQTETETQPAETEEEIIKLTDDEISCIDNTMHPFGQGRQTDANNVPLGALDFNEKYGQYGGYAYIPEGADKKEIYLTFDQGYENGYTSKILDVLKEKNVKATFFLTGHYIESEPDLIQRMIDEGHTLGNHGDKHKSLPEELLPQSIEAAENELTAVHNAVKEKFGYEMNYSRPPKGEFSERSLAVTQRLGYDSFLWSFAYADWDPANQPNEEEAFKRITESAHGGEVMLLHSVSETNANILGRVIDDLQAKGYVLTVPTV